LAYLCDLLKSPLLRVFLCLSAETGKCGLWPGLVVLWFGSLEEKLVIAANFCLNEIAGFILFESFA